MNIFRRVRTLCTTVLVLSIAFGYRVAAADPPPSPQDMLIGVSLAGPEFGTQLTEFSNRTPGRFGREYTYPNADTIAYFASSGMDLIRLPFRWERLQPELGGELNPVEMRRIQEVTRTALKNRVFVILDLHNYGRYRLEQQGVVRECVIDQRVDDHVPVSREHFQDFWKRMALEFRGDRSIVGYGLMNEPHDMGDSDWKTISQAAVDVIRLYDKETAVVVAGDDWSSAERFVEANGQKPWIRDPANHVVYEAHCYFDSDASGQYQNTFAAEKNGDPHLENRGLERVKPFLDWCQRNQVRGLIGEYGTPNDDGWREVSQRFLEACRQSQVGVIYWAAGEWWGDYPLSIQPARRHTRAKQYRWLLDVKRKSIAPR